MGGLFLIFAAVLFATQALATAWSHGAFLDLHASLAAGEALLPNALSAPRLLDWGTALCAGFFFTLSAGVTLALLACTLHVLGERSGRARAALSPYLLPFGISLALCIALALVLANATIFHRVRDYLLLPTVPGAVRFYYVHSPFAAHGLALSSPWVQALVRVGVFGATPLALFFLLFWGLSSLLAPLVPRPRALAGGVWVLAALVGLVLAYPDPGPPTHRGKMETLRRRGAGTVPIVELESALASPDPALRYWGAWATSQNPGPRSLELLTPLARDSHPMVAAAVAKALGRLGPPARDLLARMVSHHPDWYVQMAAARALGSTPR